VLCALGVRNLADPATEATFSALRRQRVWSLLSTGWQQAEHDDSRGYRDRVESGNSPEYLLCLVARAGLASLDREVVQRRLAEELVHGSSFSRYFLLIVAPTLHDWQNDLRPFADGLIAASKDTEDTVAEQATRLLGKLAADHETARQRLSAALDEPRLRAAAATGLFLATVRPGSMEQAVEMARDADPRTAVIGVGGLIGQPSSGSFKALAELLNDADWSATRPQADGQPKDGPWPRLEAIRGLAWIGNIDPASLAELLGAQREMANSAELQAAIDATAKRLIATY
jgi:hypothetical protein